MASTPGAHDIDVSSLWSGVRKCLPGLMICTIASGILTFIGLGLVAPHYEAETQLTITAKPSNTIVDGKNDASAAASITPRLDREAINTHVRALAAPDLLIKVARELKLAERPEFNHALGPVDTIDLLMRMIGIGRPNPRESEDERVLRVLQENITISAARESRFISIHALATDPALAARIANTIAETYRRSLREIPVRETNEAVEALLPKIAQLRAEVLKADAAAKRFRAETDQLTGGANNASTLQQQRLATLSADLARAEADEARSDAKLHAALDQSGRGAQSLGEVQQSKVIQDLIAERVRVERQVNEARAVLLPAHPRMRQLNADLAGLRRALEAEIANIVASIRKELRVNQLRTEKLRAQIAELKKSAVANSDNEAKLKALEATAGAKRNELERLQKQLEDNRTVVQTARVPVEATIVSRGRPSSDPAYPKKGPATLLVMAATMMLGVALIIVKELMIPKSVPHNRRASDKRNAGRGLIVDPAPPPIRAQVGDAALKPTSAPSGKSRTQAGRNAGPPPSPLAQHAIRFHTDKPDEGGFRLLVAGDRNALDPSDEAIELAHDLSELGDRVAIVDWCLDGEPLLADIDTRYAGTMANLLADEADFGDIVVALPDSNVHYIRATDQSVAADVFDEVGLNLVLDALDEAYEQVIVVGRHNDAQMLFETIQGRFDAGLVIHDSASPMSARRNGFLGFDVDGMEVVHHDRDAAANEVRV